MATVRSVAKKFMDAMGVEAGKVAAPLQSSTMPGTIVAVDGQGNATVDLGNGMRAHASLGVGARAGDNVAVEFGGMSAVVTRNTTDPPDNAVAREAEKAAEIAESAAARARSAANSAMAHLGDVEKVVDTATWIAEHGTYSSGAKEPFDEHKVYYARVGGTFSLTEDEAVIPSKDYYSRSGSGTEADPYVYSIVVEPTDEGLSGYYELEGGVFTEVAEPRAEDLADYYVLVVDESVQRYIAAHLALTDEGLNLMADWSLYRMLVAPDSVRIIDATGMERASYGAEVRVGPLSDFHIVVNGHRLEFYQGETSASYVSNNQMMIPSAIVRDMLQVGDWAFVAQESGNLSLTWIGDDA